MKNRIWLARPRFSNLEQQYLTEAIETNWVSTAGGQKEDFKTELRSFLNYDGGLSLLNTGTSALHLALILAGVEQGDYVLCSSFTFVASANPIKYVGANPIFIDSETETWNMCPLLLEEALLDLAAKGIHPRVMILVHLYGVPAQLNEILRIAAKYGVKIIEDAAGAFGSTYEGKKVGTFGDYGIFSFNGNKIVTTGAGGLLLTKNKEDEAKADFLSTQAKESKDYYEHKVVGYNYAMSNLSVAMGRGQLAAVDTFIEKKREIYTNYLKPLKAEKITFNEEKAGHYSNRWLSCIIFETQELKEKVRTHLESMNIESRCIWKPMHLQPLYKNEISSINGNSEEIFKKGLCLPSDLNMSETEQEFVITELLKIVTQ